MPHTHSYRYKTHFLMSQFCLPCPALSILDPPNTFITSVCVDSTHVDAPSSSVDGRSMAATVPTHLLVSTHECSYDMHINKVLNSLTLTSR